MAWHACVLRLRGEREASRAELAVATYTYGRRRAERGATLSPRDTVGGRGILFWCLWMKHIACEGRSRRLCRAAATQLVALVRWHPPPRVLGTMPRGEGLKITE